MANKVRYGLSNVHVAKLTEGQNGYTYGIPKALPGAVNMSMDAEGDQANFYADNRAYHVVTTNNGYSGSLEVALLPDWFLEEHLGYVKDIKGNLVEDAAQQTKPFALLFQFEGDVKATKHCIYNVNPSRPSMEGKTNEESTEVQTEEMEFIATPINVGDRKFVKTKTTETTVKEDYESWFKVAPTTPIIVEEDENEEDN